jgi:hypothetical protein
MLENIELKLTKIENKQTVAELKLTKLENKQATADQNVKTALQSVAQLNISEFDAYAVMTQTSNGFNKKKHVEWRTKYYEACNITTYNQDAVSTSEKKRKIVDVAGKVQACCLVTGFNGELKLAHLLPASTTQKIRKLLKMQDDETGIWSLRNSLLLSEKIEYYFNRKKISFIPHPLRMNSYTLKIWDVAIFNTLIYNEAIEKVVGSGDNTIGYYEGREITLRMNNDFELKPFKRVLAYQNFLCFSYHQFNHSAALNDFDREITDNEWLEMIEKKSLLLKDIARECNEEAEKIEIDLEDEFEIN